MAPSPTKRKDRSEEKSKDRSKDKAATKESGEKDRGRDKTRKRRSASSGSSSTRSRSSSTSSSGSSSSTGSSSGSSSSSASSRSGSSSTSRSSSSSSSSASPSPSRRRHDNRRRSRSKSKPPKRDEKERKRRSPSPRPTKVHVGRLTRNVTKDHIMEIFSTYGKIKMIDMPVDRLNPHLSKGYAYVEFENPDDAEKALKHMDGGPGLLGAGPLFAGDPDPGLLDEDAIAAAPAQTPQDKAKGLDSFLLFNLNPIRWNIVSFFYNESG
ncbi:PREDICTED: RNA-binding protein with serine-rich domain 1 isoform X2 [Pseudopodoces humilis]|uniref:RNA-binding protein with serine-rich domain 1 isoform X2 n=1 Tax=Pseudopodoces humilis TaxID=181119 RepID=UPI0006B6E622|nr:PREDICTED: RNA-binding protein with serine-rich domain 1 isoform X2 [Pseudopodoces humilis]